MSKQVLRERLHGSSLGRSSSCPSQAPPIRLRGLTSCTDLPNTRDRPPSTEQDCNRFASVGLLLGNRGPNGIGFRWGCRLQRRSTGRITGTTPANLGWPAKGQIGSPADLQRAECELRLTVSFKSGGTSKFHWPDPFRAVEQRAVPISLVSPTIPTTIRAVLQAYSSLGRPLSVGREVLITGATASLSTPARPLTGRAGVLPGFPAQTRPLSAARRVPV